MFRSSGLFIQMWGLNILYSLKFLLKQLFYHTFTLALHLPQRNLHHLLEARLCPHNFEYVERVGNLVRVSWQQKIVSFWNDRSGCDLEQIWLSSNLRVYF